MMQTACMQMTTLLFLQAKSPPTAEKTGNAEKGKPRALHPVGDYVSLQ